MLHRVEIAFLFMSQLSNFKACGTSFSGREQNFKCEERLRRKSKILLNNVNNKSPSAVRFRRNLLASIRQFYCLLKKKKGKNR